jgi:hypothetical protein
LEVPRFMKEGEKLRIKGLWIDHLHPRIVEHPVAAAEVKRFGRPLRFERMVGAKIEASHVVRVDKERWQPVRAHGFLNLHVPSGILPRRIVEVRRQLLRLPGILSINKSRVNGKWVTKAGTP